MNLLEVPGDDGRIILAGWVNGDLLQVLRARIPLDDPATLQAFRGVYQAIGQRFPCSNARTLVDEAGNLSDSLTGEACD